MKECSCLEAFKPEIIHVGYAKLICNMLVFFKYAHINTSVQMHILSLYICNDNRIISRCQDILFIQMIKFG